MEKDINEVLQTRRLTYFWHVTRMEKDRYPNILMHGYTHGRQPRGRPRKRWLDNITEDCEEVNLIIHQTSNGEMEKYCLQQGHAGVRGHRLRCRGFKSSQSSNNVLGSLNWSQ